MKTIKLNDPESSKHVRRFTVTGLSDVPVEFETENKQGEVLNAIKFLTEGRTLIDADHLVGILRKRAEVLKSERGSDHLAHAYAITAEMIEAGRLQ